jgi:hypothetical protein
MASRSTYLARKMRAMADADDLSPTHRLRIAAAQLDETACAYFTESTDAQPFAEACEHASQTWDEYQAGRRLPDLSRAAIR